MQGKIILVELRREQAQDGMIVILDHGIKLTIESLMVLGDGKYGVEGDALGIYDIDDFKLLAIEHEVQTPAGVNMMGPTPRAGSKEKKTTMLDPMDYDWAVNRIGTDVDWEKNNFTVGKSVKESEGLYVAPILMGEWAGVIKKTYTEEEALTMAQKFMEHWMGLSPHERMTAGYMSGEDKNKYVREWWLKKQKGKL